MSLRPQCVEVLRRVEAWGDLTEMSVAEARSLDRRASIELGGAGPPVTEVRDILVERQGDRIPARLYRPRDELAPGVLVGAARQRDHARGCA